LQQNQDSRKYDIGLSLVRVGQAYLQRLDVRERGHRYLEDLSKKLNETVHMLVLDQNEVVYVDKVDVQHQAGALQCSSFIGLRTDVYSTASGKVLLSNLEQYLAKC
jgi:IclR family transcriptional regulator, KDG regulon repressor